MVWFNLLVYEKFFNETVCQYKRNNTRKPQGISTSFEGRKNLLLIFTAKILEITLTIKFQSHQVYKVNLLITIYPI